MKKRAILIGNNNYKKKSEWDNLKSCENDVDELEIILKNLGFSVEKYKNLSASESKSKIEKFYSQSSEDGINLFYFSGHGGNNGMDDVIIPIDFYSENYITVGEIIKESENINTYNIFIFDCCRNKFISDKEHVPVLTIDPKFEVFIAKATSIGDTAKSGNKKSLSVFTNFLVKYLKAENLTLDEIFNNIKYEIKRSSSNQLPQITTTMTRSIILNKIVKESDRQLEERINTYIDESFEKVKNTTLNDVMASKQFGISYLDMKFLLDDNMNTRTYGTNLSTEYEIKYKWIKHINKQRGYNNSEGKSFYEGIEFELGNLPQIIDLPNVHELDQREIIKVVFKNIEITIDRDKNLDFKCNVLNLDNNFKLFLVFRGEGCVDRVVTENLVVENGKIRFFANIHYIDLEKYTTLQLRSVVMTQQDGLSKDIKEKYGHNSKNLFLQKTYSTFGETEERKIFLDLSEYIRHV